MDKKTILTGATILIAPTIQHFLSLRSAAFVTQKGACWINSQHLKQSSVGGCQWYIDITNAIAHCNYMEWTIFTVQYLHGVSSCACSECLMKQTHIRSRCICKVFLQCAFYCGLSKMMPKRLKNHSGHICWFFLQCVFFCGLSMYVYRQMIIHTGHTYSVSLHCVFSYDFSDGLIVSSNNCTGCIWRASLRCAPSYVFSD